MLAPYQLVDGKPHSPEYDPSEFREEVKGWLDPLGLAFDWHKVTMVNAADTIASIKSQRDAGPLIILNLCDGSETDGYPGLSVIHALNAARLPYTGASAEFYEQTTSKVATKELLFATGIATPAFAPVHDGHIELDARHFPVIVKPDVSAASTGIHVDSVCNNAEEVAAKVARLKASGEFANSRFFAESFVQGREFTVLLVEAENEPLGLWTLPPCERVFDPRVPESERFLIFERYWDLPDADRPIPAGDKYYWYEFAPKELSQELAMTARRAMRGVGGAGYARVDMRIDEKTGTVYVLEVNAQCGLSVEDSTTVGSMLRLSGTVMSDVIQRILQHGLTRL